jgi:hypothetical protein
MCAKTLTQPIKPYPKKNTIPKVAEAGKQARQQTISNWNKFEFETGQRKQLSRPTYLFGKYISP